NNDKNRRCPMDELMWLRMFGGSFGGSGFDVTALIAFIAFAVIYLVAPVIGYRPKRPASMLAALYILLVYGAISVMQMLLQWFHLLDRGGRMFERGNGEAHILFGFAILKIVVFLAALLAFVIGLGSLRLQEPEER